MVNEAGGGPPSSQDETDRSPPGPTPAPEGQDHQFRALVDAVDEYAICRLDPAGTVVSWNTGAERIKGYDAEEIVGEPVSTFYTVEDRAAGVPEQNLADAAEHGSVEDEGWRVCADGSRFWANVIITAIRDSDGELDGFAKVTRDMTERREQNEQLREERDFTQQVLDTAPASIFVIDAAGDSVMANDRHREKLGIDDESGDGSIGDLTVYDEAGEPVPPAERPYRAAVETGEGVDDWLCQLELPSGERQWVSVNASPIVDEDGDVERVVVSSLDVTQLREQAMRLERRRDELETELAEIFDRIDEAFLALDEDWRITYVNDRAAELVRLSAGELLEAHVWDVLPEVADGRPRAMAERAMETQEPVEFEFHSAMLGIWVEVRAYPSASGMSVYFRDVTKRKERERALEESERRYRTLVENVPSGGIGLVDHDLRYRVAGGKSFEAVGLSAEEVEGRRIDELYDAEIVDRLSRRYRAALDGESSAFEIEVGDRELEMRTIPVRDESGTVFAALGMTQDITERVERERELETRARQQAVISDLGQYALETPDLDELIAEAARKVAEVLGNDYCQVLELDADEGELLLRQGVGWGDDVVGQARVSAVEANSQASYTLLSEEPVVATDLETETRFSGPGMLVSRGVKSGISTIIGSVDEPWGILGTHDTERRSFAEMDVNFVQTVANILAEAIERHRYQEEREQLIDDLKESNERLEQFAYAASHDLQEPLRMVSSFLQLIEDRYGDTLDEDGREFIGFAVDGADRMREMIDGLLEYSRVGTQGDPFEPVDLDAVVADAIADLQVRIVESDAEITTGSLPRVEGDANQLRQVFQNLLGNAIEYAGDEPPRVHVSAQRDGSEWIVSIHDEGIGIAPDDQERVFELFQRLHSREESPGTGIGLALCERIVERHDGRIWVDSAPGEGSTFSFTLPAAGAEGG